MAIELVDIGVNLEHRSFERDRAEVIKRAANAGVTTLVLTGTSVRTSERVLQLAEEAPPDVKMYSTAGVHPHDARTCNDGTIATLRQLAQNPRVVAIGECGLDFNRDFSPRPVQERWFEAQVALACELNLPLFLHERDAHERFCQIIEKYRPKLTAGGVVHCFTGDERELQKYLALDLHIGITGWICDERRGQHLLELVRQIPLDRLMLETDAPFLTPRNIQPRPKDSRNEPAYLIHVLRAVARSTGKPVNEIASATTATARNFFGLNENA
jgi:TatD DNase family protein